MKKNVWITIITVITIFCVIGGVIYHLGVHRTGFFGWGEVTDMSSELDAFDTVNADAELMSITITAGSRFYMSCEYTDGLEPVYEVKNGALTVKQRQYKRWGINNNAQCSLTLTIPDQTVMDTIDVRTALGDIRLEGITSSKCELQSNLGNCTLEKCSFDEADFNTNLGEVSVSNTSLRDAEASSDMGGIKVESCTFDDLSLSTSMGDAKVDSLQDLSGYDMDLESNMGSVKVNNRDEGTTYHQKGSAGNLEIDTSMGSIRVTY